MERVVKFSRLHKLFMRKNTMNIKYDIATSDIVKKAVFQDE